MKDFTGTGDYRDPLEVYAFPLDPTRWELPGSDPNDHTAPVINLTEPINATLLP